MIFESTAKLIRSPDIIASEVDGELVLISIQDGKYFGLDMVGSEIWKLLENPVSTSGLTAMLRGMFDDGSNAIEQDVIEFIDEVSKHGLVREA